MAGPAQCQEVEWGKVGLGERCVGDCKADRDERADAFGIDLVVAVVGVPDTCQGTVPDRLEVAA